MIVVILSCSDATYALTIHGRLTDHLGEPIAVGSVVINGSETHLDKNGFYSRELPLKRSYSFLYEAEGYYRIIHTFSHEELVAISGELPAVQLVAKEPGRVMFAFGGDTMMGRRFRSPFVGEPQHIRPGHELEDCKQLLLQIKPYMELADYSSVNLESAVIKGKPKAKAKKLYTFYSPPETVPALQWAGIDYVSLGNNHLYDYLESGIESTLHALDGSEISYSGAGLTESQALAAHHQKVGEQEYAFLSFVSWKGKSTPHQCAEGESKGGAALGNLNNIATTVTQQASMDRAVVMQYHSGKEYSYFPSEITTKSLHSAIDAGADLVIGHHPHVLQGFEIYKGKLIAYSLGNFLFDQYRYETQRSAMVYVWMDGEKFYRAELVPLHIQNYRPVPATGAIRDYVIRRVTHQSQGGGVNTSISGGHLVIGTSVPVKGTESKSVELTLTEEIDASSITRLPLNWFQRAESVSSKDRALQFRSGRDVLLKGGFEYHHRFGLADSDWEFSHADSKVTSASGRSGSCSLVIQNAKRGTDSIARQKYYYRFVDANHDIPYSLVGYVKSQGKAKLRLCLDLWRKGWSRTRAQSKPEHKCFAEVLIDSEDWQPFVANLGTLDDTYKGYRICLKSAADKKSPESAVHVDDLALIAWQPNSHEFQGEVLIDLNQGNYIRFDNMAAEKSPIRLKVIDNFR